MWWLLIPPAIWLGKVIYDAVEGDCEESPSRTPAKRPRKTKPRVVFEERGDLQGDKVVVIGRTGAGKSSLINMLRGKQVLPVGHVGSTTRWVEGVRVELKKRDVVLVDTPGYGEAMTAEDYARGLLDWIRRHKTELSMVVLVLQADSKAHAEDKRILTKVMRSCPEVPLALVLGQVDKITPVREPLKGKEWSSRKRRTSMKNSHIAEKIGEVCAQFGIEETDIAPAAADGVPFNRKKLLRLIEKQLPLPQ